MVPTEKERGEGGWGRSEGRTALPFSHSSQALYTTNGFCPEKWRQHSAHEGVKAGFKCLSSNAVVYTGRKEASKACVPRGSQTFWN